MRTLLFVVLFLAASTANAQVVPNVILQIGNKYYRVTSMEEVRVVRVDGSPTPTEGKLTDAVKAATKGIPAYANRKRDAKAVILAYQTAAASLEDGADLDETKTKLGQLRAQLFTAFGAGGIHWKEVWAAAVDPLVKDGTKAEALESYKQIAAAMEAVDGKALPAAAAGFGDIIKQLLALFGGDGDGDFTKWISFIFKLIELFGGLG